MLSRIRVFGLVVALLCGLTLSLHAQTPTPTPAPVQMTLSSPFAFTVKPLLVKARAGKWVPIAVTLVNTGEPVSGQVELRLAAQNTQFDYAPNVVTADVELPTNSSKRIWLYARLDRPDVDGLDVSFSGRGFPQLSERVPVQQPDPLQQEVMIVSDADIGLSDTLRALRTQALFRGGKAPTNSFGTGVAPVSPFSFGKELVPDRWIGFQGADIVVLGDFPHIGLSPTQIDALRGYVQGGGTLVVMGGPNASRLGSSPLKDLWPLVPTTSVSASSDEVAKIVSRYVPHPQNGGDRLGGAPVVITRGTLTSDAIRLDGTAARPLFVEREEGAGRVLFLAYDPSQPPFKGWSGQGQLWTELINHTASVSEMETVDANFLSAGGNFSGGVPPSYYSSDEGTSTATGRLLTALSHAEQLTMPPVSRIAWFLALYVFFLVPVNYAVLRIIDRRELAWVTIPVIVVAFSVWAYSEALSIRGRAILTRQMDIVQSSVGSKRGRVDSLFWLFSPKRTTYDISTQGQTAALSDYATKAGGEQGNFTLLQPPDGSSFKIQGAPLRMWTDRAFSSQSLGDLKQGVSLSGNALRNSTGINLHGVVWVQEGRVTGIGELKNGGSATVVRARTTVKKLGTEIMGEITRVSKLEDVFDKSSLANGIPQAALATALGDGFGKLNETPLLIAWGEKSVAPFSIGAESGQGRQIALFVFRVPKVPTQLAAHEATVRRVSFEPFTPGDNPSEGGFAYFDAHLDDRAAPPKNLMISARGTGASQFTSENYRYQRRLSPVSAAPVPPAKMVRFEALNVQNARWEKIGGSARIDPSPAGGWNFYSAVSSEYVRQPDNTLRIRVRLENAGVKVSTLTVRE